MFTRGKDLLQIDGLEVKRRETAQKTSPCFTQSPLGCNTIERRYSHNAGIDTIDLLTSQIMNKTQMNYFPLYIATNC